MYPSFAHSLTPSEVYALPCPWVWNGASGVEGVLRVLGGVDQFPSGSVSCSVREENHMWGLRVCQIAKRRSTLTWCKKKMGSKADTGP
jgi:hypothetical protein